MEHCAQCGSHGREVPTWDSAIQSSRGRTGDKESQARPWIVIMPLRGSLLLTRILLALAGMQVGGPDSKRCAVLERVGFP